MDEFIRQLTHDNEQFEKQWPDIYNKLNKLLNVNSEIDLLIVKVKSLDALVDYILADTEKVIQIKLTFLDIVIKQCIDDLRPSLNELVRIFCRILDISNTNNLFYLTFLEKFYYKAQLGEELSKNSSTDLIDSIFNCLQKHEFLDKNLDTKIQETWKHFLSRGVFSPLSSDKNKLNYEDTMTNMRSSFQKLYRWAALNSYQSKIWSEVPCVLTCTLPTLFNNYTNSDDVQYYLTTCLEPSISSDYVKLISKSYQCQVDMFKTNASQIYTTIVKLVSQNRIDDAGYFMDNVLIIHFNSISNLEELLHMLIHICSLVNIESRSLLCKTLISPISYELTNKKCNKNLARIFFDFVLAILNLNIIEAPKYADHMLSINDFYPWKQLDKQITHLIQSCINYDNIINDEYFSELDNLRKILSLINERSKIHVTILHATHESALQAVLKWSTIINNDTGKPYDKHVFEMGQPMTELIDRRQIPVDICSKFLEILRKQIDNNDEIYDFNYFHHNFFLSVTKLLAECIVQLKNLPLTLHQQIASFCLAAFNCPFTNEDGSMTLSHSAGLALWCRLPQYIHNEDDAYPYESCADRLYQLVYKEEEQQLYQWWINFWCIIGLKYQNVAVNHIPQFLDEIINRKRLDLLSTVSALYNKRPEPFHARLDDLIHALFDCNGQHLTSLSILFDTIVKVHPELITSKHIDSLFTSIKNHMSSFDQTNYIFQALGYVANAQPHLFDKYQEELLHFVIEQHSLSAFSCLQQYLVASTIIKGEKTADENLTLLINLIKNTKNISTDLKSQIFYTCQLIGVKYKEILATKRNDLIPFESDSACQVLINFIDENKLNEENQAAINRTLDEIAQIEKRVVHTERDVQNITKVVKRQELNITNLNTRVNIFDTRINDITEQVEYHTREIERIDMKTLSYVPSEWGRDVCTLLNIRADNDWRLLGKRFGYSTSELKHWSMQMDPSMSLLNEWFMTHKTDEATYGLLKILNDIGRQDVEEIIRKALTKAGELIPDDISIEIKRLPPIFLSYQWSSQKAVLKLKTNLEQAGYSCWMDTGQMGGGDKLFAKIDAGIRGAKVVICCMNKTYAQSDNCSREVHLTISTGKPLIPLQMEKQPWPPEGALGPIMSEYLYIRFYDRKNHDENYWPTDKFAELLGQIRYYVAPDPDMITQQYYNWFVPRVDNLIFLQSQTTNDNKDKTIIKDNLPLVVTHPQIMISYQWDYQKDIINLYEKLTKLGYRCWLDIFQMGGGDSLFEKIDAGIRHAKCILSCVTPKYIKSINCRREMALADALKKPILPLLLEEISTWPPAGPMAMIFAEKPYIDFRCSTNDSERWIGKEFELVLARLKQIIPEVQTEKPQRHLIDMQRPTTAMKRQEKKPQRIRSAPVTPQSRACSLM
ncbi:unnamed protein product [Rotaria sordida]|uniref:Death domain-containing protein n=3 Tax=Rotaria sordida TaxID=392033 RepID=A0A818WB68_9BILA|nr:unnamed protein product [Rotaria sordida]